MKIRGAACVAVGVLVLAGCSGESGDGETPEPAAKSVPSAKDVLLSFSECDTSTIETTAKMPGFKGAICDGYDGEQVYKVEAYADPAQISGNGDYTFDGGIEVFILGDDSDGSLTKDVEAAGRKGGYEVAKVAD